MSILIKGMEMPINCATCYRDGTHYHVHMLVGCPYLQESIHSHDFRKERHPNCPLIEVPEPHGRLIDADKMRGSIRKQTAFLRLIGGEFAEIAETLEKGFLQEIDNAPTIIPAEEKET